MLRVGWDRLINKWVILPTMVCDAEALPFPDNHFDLVSVAFGLRNMTHKDAALKEMNRVLRPGGKLLVLEFSKVRSEEHTSELQSHLNLVCRLLLEKKQKNSRQESHDRPAAVCRHLVEIARQNR